MVIKRKAGDVLFDIFNVVFMVVLCLVTVYPYINQLALSLNTGSDAIFGGITFYPREFTLNNYETIFANQNVKSALVISVARVIIGTILGLLITTGAAYAVSKRDLPGKKFIVWFLILPMFISAGLIPTFILYRYLHLINNFWVYVIPGCFVFYNMVIIRTFMQGIPVSLEESAYLDGANEFQILVHIILPLCMPVMATVCLWVAVSHWNDWISSLLYVTKTKLHTIQYILLKVVKESEVTQKMAESLVKSSVTNQGAKPTAETVKAATIILTTLPIVALYPFLQKYFVKGVTIGALKE